MEGTFYLSMLPGPGRCILKSQKRTYCTLALLEKQKGIRTDGTQSINKLEGHNMNPAVISSFI